MDHVLDEVHEGSEIETVQPFTAEKIECKAWDTSAVEEATAIRGIRIRENTSNVESFVSITGGATMPATELPVNESIIFRDSSFFKRLNNNTTLPSTTEVRGRALAQGFKYPGNPPPIRFPEMGLIVKSRTKLTIAEGQCLWAIRRLLKDQVPVPEVYGWARDGSEIFIYMELIQGETLERRWESLSTSEHLEVCNQLRKMISALRCLKQDPQDPFIGSIGRKPLLDILFEGRAHYGPFGTVKEFHDFFAAQVNRFHPNIKEFVDPMRSGLPDDSPITFTHADLHPSNIMLTPADVSPVRVLAIVDWHQSGWYPAYWEYCNTVYCVDMEDDWAANYVPMFLEKPSCFKGWWYYMDGLGF